VFEQGRLDPGLDALARQDRAVVAEHLAGVVAAGRDRVGVDDLGFLKERLGRPHRRLVGPLGLADVGLLLGALPRADPSHDVVGVGLDREAPLAEAVGGTQREPIGRRDAGDAQVVEPRRDDAGFRHRTAVFGRQRPVVVVRQPRDLVGAALGFRAAELQGRHQDRGRLGRVDGRERIRGVEPREVPLGRVRAVGVDEVAVEVGPGEVLVEPREVGIHTCGWVGVG